MPFENLTSGEGQEFLPKDELLQRFVQQPDPVLAAHGGSVIEACIGLDRTMYALELSVDEQGQPDIHWVETSTQSRRAKASLLKKLVDGRVPLTLDAVVDSLCTTFQLSMDKVWKEGADLLAFWSSIDAGTELELPMSRDWARFCLAKYRAA